MANYNKIQKNQVEQEQNTLKIAEDITRNDLANCNDNVFLNTVNISFDNNKYVNAMFMNQIKDKENSDLYLSDNIVFDSVEANMKVKDVTKKGVYYSVEKCTNEDYDSDLNNFFLIVDNTVPDGCDIVYYLITDDNRKFIIKPNATTPLVLTTPCKRFRLSAKLSCNGIDTPALNAFAVLYYDEYIAKAFKMNLDGEIPEEGEEVGEDDLITLIRDNTMDDKLVEVLTTDTKINLLYDKEKDRLSEVRAYDINTGKLIETNNLIYEDYVNSNNETEEVLTKIKINR